MKKVSWSVLVRTELAVHVTSSKVRGFLTAPLAFKVSWVLRKGTLEVLALKEAEPAGPSPLLALTKELEYGCLGLAVARVGRGAYMEDLRLASRRG